ncbi:choice-of-anchor Q domain-containing protein [Sandaracinus amylolyticus]|uniref:choice-of-anchor Q domain-containing protein n=1 Tax=Sandaracinus amylolyticus TaxID=927083 RepID=UPI001F1DC554|nr:choice-of-anchor Q domain-containing protein [Sandaracinus amylolyticus]UJR78148.1 Hypothetical protein I5071_1750 [Sandaracinus amylolyticus]
MTLECAGSSGQWEGVALLPGSSASSLRGMVITEAEVALRVERTPALLDALTLTGNAIDGLAVRGDASATNPFFVAPGTDLRLTSGSQCIDAGTSTGAPTSDRDGTVRPLDGDGINGPAHDMGAYEYAAVTVCGDSVVGAGESCDDGALNGMYGRCNASCTGPGPRCGDATTNGPEQCDDGNASDTDACLGSCVSARCGDGVVRAGVEDCDDVIGVALAVRRRRRA